MRPEKAKPSVCWYAPLQLLRTARLVAIATIFGQHADPRLVDAISRMMGANEARWALRHSDRTTTATTQLPFGSTTSAIPDGWDATYTVAYYAAQDELTLALDENPSHGDDTLRAGACPEQTCWRVTRCTECARVVGI